MTRTMYVRFLNSSYISDLSSTNNDQNDQTLRCLENVNREGEFFKIFIISNVS